MINTWDDYEPDFNFYLHQEPIFYKQAVVIKRRTKMPMTQILRLSSEEANVFINTLNRKIEWGSFEWLCRNKYGHPTKFYMEREGLVSALSCSNGSEASQVFVYSSELEKISNSESKT